jgi:glycosyltransferase involved in cell wall biosynthesis
MDLISLFRLVFLLRNIKPDVVLSYTAKPVIYGTIAAYLANVLHKVALIEGLGFAFTDSGSTLKLKRKIICLAVSFLYKLSLRKAQAVVFLNSDDIQDFVKLGLVDLKKVFCLGGIGVDLNHWPVSLPTLSPVTFLLVARLLHEKGVKEFADAAQLIKTNYPTVRFILLGGLDSNPGGIKQCDVEAWVDQGVLEWPGHVIVKPWMDQCSVFVLPSYREGVPRSTQEAMAIGRAVITTDSPGCRETVIDGFNGFLVPVKDSVALSKKMLKFVEDNSLIEKMGIASRKIAEERFDVHAINNKFREILHLT